VSLGPGSVIAIDPGAKHTGFAVADALRIAVEPLDTFHGDGESEALVDHVQGLVDERSVAALIVGLPLHQDGSESERSKAARAFADRLRARFPRIPVILRDEHLTTKEAEAQLHEAGYRGAELRARSDAWAAKVLLEEWIRLGEPAD
jgi:putative Holliday junction resolvase